MLLLLCLCPRNFWIPVFSCWSLQSCCPQFVLCLPHYYGCEKNCWILSLFQNFAGDFFTLLQMYVAHLVTYSIIKFQLRTWEKGQQKKHMRILTKKSAVLTIATTKAAHRQKKQAKNSNIQTKRRNKQKHGFRRKSQFPHFLYMQKLPFIKLIFSCMDEENTTFVCVSVCVGGGGMLAAWLCYAHSS